MKQAFQSHCKVSCRNYLQASGCPDRSHGQEYGPPCMHQQQSEQILRCSGSAGRGSQHGRSDRQAVYNPQNALKFLDDYAYLCEYENVPKVPIIFTFTPCGDLSTLKFMRWLGIDVPLSFEAALNSYVASYESAMNTAKTDYEQTKADKSQINAAQENVNCSKKAYEEANAKVEKIKGVNQQVAKAYKAYKDSWKVQSEK